MVKLRYRKLKSGKYSLFLDCYSSDMTGNKKRQYVFLGKQVDKDYTKVKNVIKADQETILLAEEIRKAKELELIGGIRGVKMNHQGEDVTLLELLEDQYGNTNSSRTKSIIYNIRKFTGDGDIGIGEVTPEWLERFRLYMENNMSTNGARTYLTSLKARFKKAIKKGIIKDSPFNNFKIPVKQEQEITTLNEDQVKKLVETPLPKHPHLRLAFLFSCFTGLRSSDIRALRWKDLHKLKREDSSSYILLRIKPIKTLKKTDKLLTVPLSESAKMVLETLTESSKGLHGTDSLVFDGLPSERHSGDLLKLWAARAGIRKNVHFHVGRHTFATIGLTRGMDIYTVSKLLGHSSIRNTEVYAKIIDEKKQEEIRKIPRL